MLGNLDPAKILVILVLVLVLVGPEKLPKVARTLGAAWREFARVRQEVVDEVRAALPDTEDLPRIPRIPSVRGTLTGFISDASPARSAATDARAGNGSRPAATPTRPASGGGRAEV
ncbi:MAG: twin-arginine translocase TatA/TatE family subunit, partial [Acidimicrobiales bacterium]